jgi:hypothetical protein
MVDLEQRHLPVITALKMFRKAECFGLNEDDVAAVKMCQVPYELQDACRQAAESRLAEVITIEG